MANNNPFYPNPANPYMVNNNYGTSYAPQTGGYMAGNQTPNPYQNQQINRFQSIPGRLVNNLDEITPQEDDDRMGYNSRRYSNGRYAPKGRGSRMGYIPPFMMKPYYMEEYGRWNDDEWDPSEMMGYTNGRSNNPQSENSSRSSYNGNRSQSGTQMGYERDNEWDPDRDPTHSMTYNEYRKAKRHYMESRNPSDKQSMDDYGQRHVHEALDTLKDIWKDADPTMRKKMKTEIQTVLNEMPT